MNQTKPKTMKEAAGMMASAFEERERADGSEYWALREGSPEWMKDVCREAHGDMFPDDWRYRFISNACDLLAADEADNIDVEADVYTGRLTSWLNSRVDRLEYCDEYRAEINADGGDMFALLSGGQYMERVEVLGLVRHALAAVVDA